MYPQRAFHAYWIVQPPSTMSVSPVMRDAAGEAEITILQDFLPQAMPAEELRGLVQAAIAETGAASPADMGKVMKSVMPKVAGRAPNDMVSATVRELLQK